jgi:asparagine synthase (glutamine-hydrolysing)
MCGIAATINGNWSETTKMTEAQYSRGTSHTYHDAGHGVRVGFNHLPITGNYPQPYIGDKYKVWFNGFISNHRELTHRYGFRSETGTDTECLGQFLDRDLPMSELNGFFSVLKVNRQTGEWSAITDRHGIKQLYTYTNDGATYIASEVKAILSVISDRTPQPSAVFDWKYSLGVMTPHTIFRGIQKVPRLSVPRPSPISPTYDQAVESVRDLLSQAIVRNHAKIKTGVFLSGGIDSGFLAQAIQPDYCLSMDYQESNLSEIDWIKRQSVGVHVTMIHNQETFNRFAPPCLDALDDLRAGACYTNYALTQLASQVGVRVLYSGAGADEIFRGYAHRYDKPVYQITKRTNIFPLSDQPCYHSHEDYDMAYLRGILTVEDRMSGAFAIETRYPYLDNDLVSYLQSLPAHYKLGATNKQLLTDATGLLPRKKKGFSNPITNDQWVNYAYEYLRSKYPVSSVE